MGKVGHIYDRAQDIPVQPYGYTGRRFDSETGLWYFRARYFDSGLGRFISRDPLGYVDGMSTYRGYYIPMNVDPTGKIVPPDEIGPDKPDKDPYKLDEDEIRVTASIGDPVGDNNVDAPNSEISIQAMYQRGHCPCCERVYWRQYARTHEVWTSYLRGSPEYIHDWHLDGGPVYDNLGDGYERQGYNRGQRVTITYVEDRPGRDDKDINRNRDVSHLMSPQQFYPDYYWLKEMRQDFVTQLICEKKDGSESILYVIHWGHKWSRSVYFSPSNPDFPRLSTPEFSRYLFKGAGQAIRPCR
jgi:RHS repeat-associated protein